MIMDPTRDTTQQNSNANVGRSSSVSNATGSNDELLQSAAALWLVLVSHAQATVDGFRLDIKLAATSLVGLLITGFVIALLLIGLWFLAMGLLFSALVALQVPVVVVLLIIVFIQLVLLFFCHRFAKRMLENLEFKAMRAALSDTSYSEIAP